MGNSGEQAGAIVKLFLHTQLTYCLCIKGSQGLVATQDLQQHSRTLQDIASTSDLTIVIDGNNHPVILVLTIHVLLTSVIHTTRWACEQSHHVLDVFPVFMITFTSVVYYSCISPGCNCQMPLCWHCVCCFFINHGCSLVGMRDQHFQLKSITISFPLVIPTICVTCRTCRAMCTCSRGHEEGCFW